MPPKTTKPTEISNEAIEAKIKDAIDSNATDNPHVAIDPDTGKMAVVGDATEIETPDYKYEIEYEYTPEMLSPEDKKNCREQEGRYFLKLTYSNKRVKPIYRTKVVMILTRVLADALVIDAEGYSSDHIEGSMILKVLDDHLDDIIEIARMTLGVDREQLEYMTMPSLGIFFGDFMKNEPNIIEECVRFLSQSLSDLVKTQAKKKSKTTPQN